MPIQVIAPIRDQALQEQLALAQVLNQGAQGYLGYQDRQKAQQGKDAALAALTAPQPGQLGAGGMGPPTAPTPGIPEQEALALVLSGAAPEIIAQRYAQPAPITPYQQATLDLQRQKMGQQQPKAPQTRDVLQGNERVFQQYDPATGQYVEVGRGPAFAPPTQISIGDKPIEGSAAAPMVTLPGTIAEIPQIEQYLFPGGQFDRTRAGLLMVPGLREMAGAGGPYASIRAAVQAKLRRESGAAIGEREVDEQMGVYLPSPLDTEDSARSKWERFKREVLSTLETSTRGHGEAPPPPNVPPLTSSQPNIIDRAVQQGMSALQGATGGGPAAPALRPGATVDEVIDFYAR